MKITLVQTCGSCPEQYDAMVDDERVGYLRLRFGNFTVKSGGEQVYQKYIGGGLTGSFKSEKQRRKQLKKAKKAIKRRLKREAHEIVG